MLFTDVEYKYTPKLFFLICKKAEVIKTVPLFLNCFVKLVWFTFKMFALYVQQCKRKGQKGGLYCNK